MELHRRHELAPGRHALALEEHHVEEVHQLRIQEARIHVQALEPLGGHEAGQDPRIGGPAPRTH
eukprot:1542150-Lingulodinium_polyedra.AAC.1